MTNSRYIPGYSLIPNPKIMIIGESPTPRDIATGKPFSDNRELDELLRDAGITKSQCWLTYVCKYYVPPSPKKGGYRTPFHLRAKEVNINLDEQVIHLQTEVNEVKPNLIIGIGRTAINYVAGKKSLDDYRGSILMGMGRKFIGTYNPAHLNWQATDAEFIGYWHKVIILFDLKRALRESFTPEFNLPKRNLQVARSSNDLLAFKSKYADSKLVAADIEAGGHYLPVCIGFSFTPSHGMTVPLWNQDGISNIPNGELSLLWITVNEILNQYGIIGQNFNYDRDKILRLGFTVKNLYSDIMLKAQALHPEFPKNLAFNQSVRTLEPFYKNEGMYEGSYEDLFIGCARDACVTKEIDEVTDVELAHIKQDVYFHNFLMKLPNLYWSIEQQGFKVDEEKRKELIRKYISWSEGIKYKIFKIVGAEVNYNSPKQVEILLYHNWKYPNKGGTGEEALTALLGLTTKGAVNDPLHRECIELIGLGRRVEKSIGTNLMAQVDFDGRMRTTYFPCLDTGRSSTGQQDPPIRPTVEIKDFNNKKKDKVLGHAFQAMTKHGDVGEDVRSMYIPDEDEEIFVQLDSSQAEARVIFLLAQDFEALTLIGTVDYHALTASWFFGGTEQTWSKKVLGYEHPIRFTGKMLRHAGHLGASGKRAASEVNTAARKLHINTRTDEKSCKEALKIFHNKQPKIKGVFQQGVIDCLNRDRTLFAGIPYGFDVDYGGRRVFHERWGDELFRQAFSYIPQRTVSDNTKGAGIRIRERIPNVKIIIESHDSLLICMPEIKLREWIPIMKQEFERPISFKNCSLPRKDLIIPCEVEIGHNYQELSKFKLEMVPING